MTHPDGSRSAEHGRVLAGVKAMPFGWPTASLDPDSGRDPPARSGSPAAEFGGGLKRQKWVFTVSGDCHRGFEASASASAPQPTTRPHAG